MKVNLMKPIFNEEMKKAAIDALQNERFVLGENVFKFEEEFARYCGADFAISTSSGTNALNFALIGLGIKREQEVLTSPASFIATANSILHANAVPTFADIELKTYCINPRELEKNITEKTKAVIPVHLYGFPANMDSISQVTEKHKLYIIEDACQAHGAEYKGRRVGGFGNAASFSF